MIKCSICSSTLAVRQAVNDAFAAGGKLVNIARESGFSKSALSRHRRKCLPRLTLRAHKLPASVKLTILRPGGIGGDPSYPPDPIPEHIDENEVLLLVEYEKAAVPTPPPATPHDFADSEPEPEAEPNSHQPSAPEKTE